MVGCPIDHKDNSKRWCSTKVDSEGNHIANQNEYGYCADDCPIDDEIYNHNELTSKSVF